MIKYFLILVAAMMTTAAAAAAAAARTSGHLRSPSGQEISLKLESRPYRVEDGNFSDDSDENSQIDGTGNSLFPASLLAKKRNVASDFLCGRWDDWCQQGSNRPGLSCCSGYHCKCHLLWNSNCRCRSKLFGGK